MIVYSVLLGIGILMAILGFLDWANAAEDETTWTLMISGIIFAIISVIGLINR